MANEADELSFKVKSFYTIPITDEHFEIYSFLKAGDIVYVLEMSDTDWWKARVKGKEGQVLRDLRDKKKDRCKQKRVRSALGEHPP